MNKGLLIAVCGLDGSGKSTQIEMMVQKLKQEKLSVFLTKQPTESYRNDVRVRNYLDNGICPNMEVLGMLAAADRKWHITTIINPNLEKGNHVITDRYLYSSLAFFKVRGLDVEYVRELNSGVPKPDLTIFLDVPPKRTLERVAARDGEAIKFEERDSKMFEKIRAAFFEVLPDDALIIDGTATKEDVHEQIMQNVVHILGAGVEK